MLIFALAALMQPATPPASSSGPLRYYPERAQRMNIEGAATLDCEVEATGQLSDCKVVSESPEGYGFGDAALRMSSLFKMKPKMKDGQPAAARVTIPVNFKLPREAPSPPRMLAPGH